MQTHFLCKHIFIDGRALGVFYGCVTFERCIFAGGNLPNARDAWFSQGTQVHRKHNRSHFTVKTASTEAFFFFSLFLCLRLCLRSPYTVCKRNTSLAQGNLLRLAVSSATILF